jgi:hypothetical protein
MTDFDRGPTFEFAIPIPGFVVEGAIRVSYAQ